MIAENCRPSRRDAFAAVLAAMTLDGAAIAAPSLRGDGDRLPAHADLWARIPLPFTPAQAWHLLTPETQAEIDAAVIGQHLAAYVFGDGKAELDQFLDGDLRSAACDVEHDLMNRMDDRPWSLFPDLYGPDGDHPTWALDSGMVHPLGVVPPEPPLPEPADDLDPILGALAAWEIADRSVTRALAETAGDESAEAEARCQAEDDRRDGLEKALRATMPTTLPGLAALIRHYAATASDPESNGLPHLVEAAIEFVGDRP